MQTLDPSKYIVNFHGILLSGYQDGTAIQVERDTDSFSDVAGTDGEVARVKSADKRGTVTVTLLQTSVCNDLLMAELAKDEGTGLNVGPTYVKDASGRSTAGGVESWLLKPAPISLGKEVVANEWKIRVAQLDMFVGGN